MATKTTPPLRDAVREYLDRLDFDSAKTIKTHTRWCERFAEYVIAGGSKQVGRLTREDYEGFFRAIKRGDKRAGCMKAGGNAEAARLSAHACLKAMHEYFVYRGWCRSDLVDWKTLRKRIGKPMRKNFLRLKPSELQAALDSMTHPRDRAVIAAAMHTGLRSSEISRLTIGDLDLVNGFIYTRVYKTNESDNIPIDADFDRELRRYLAWYAEHVGYSLPDLPDDYLLFPAKHGDFFTGEIVDGKRVQSPGPLKVHSVMSQPQLIALRALRNIGISEDQLEHEGLHTFRRSVARNVFDFLKNEGGYSNAITFVQAMLHHKSQKTTELYIGLDSAKAERDQRIQGRSFFGDMLAAEKAKTAEVHSIRKDAANA